MTGKNQGILYIVQYFQNKYGAENVLIKDHWGADRNAIGLTDKSEKYLAYISPKPDNENQFYLELEKASVNDELPYLPVGDFDHIDLTKLEELVTNHLSLTPSMQVLDETRVIRPKSSFLKLSPKIWEKRIPLAVVGIATSIIAVDHFPYVTDYLFYLITAIVGYFSLTQKNAFFNGMLYSVSCFLTRVFWDMGDLSAREIQLECLIALLAGALYGLALGYVGYSVRVLTRKKNDNV